MKHILTAVTAAALLLACGDDGRPPNRPATPPAEPGGTDTSPAPEPPSVPAPARPPDTIGTRRPMPPRTPPTVVPDSDPPAPTGEAAQVVPARELHAGLVDSKPR